VHDLPLADVAAFSFDDAATTEIDDAFSVSPRAAGGVRIGIHIAAPALGITLDTAAEAIARERLSTVYHPAGKITMLPEAWIQAYTLAQGRDCPALSLYVEVNSSGEIAGTQTRVERVHIAGNLRHDTLEPVFNSRAASIIRKTGNYSHYGSSRAHAGTNAARAHRSPHSARNTTLAWITAASVSPLACAALPSTPWCLS
jgi:exoribonuclease R